MGRNNIDSTADSGSGEQRKLDTREERAVDSSIADFETKHPTGTSTICGKDQFTKKLVKQSASDSLDDALKELNEFEIKVVNTIVSGKDALLNNAPRYLYKDLVIVLSCLKRLQLETQRGDCIYYMVVCDSKVAADVLWEKFKLYLHLSPGVKVISLTSNSELNREEIIEGGVDVLIGTQEEFESILQVAEIKEQLKHVKHLILAKIQKLESEIMIDLLCTMENDQLVCWVSDYVESEVRIKPLMIDPVLFPHTFAQSIPNLKCGSQFKNHTHCALKINRDVKFEILFQLLQQQMHLKVLVCAFKHDIVPMNDLLTKHGIKSLVQEETGEKGTHKSSGDAAKKFQLWESGVLLACDPRRNAVMDVDLVVNYSYKLQTVISALTHGFVIHLVINDSKRERVLEGLETKHWLQMEQFTDIDAVRGFYNNTV